MRRLTLRTLALTTATALAFGAGATAAEACTNTWTGAAGNGAWGTAGNWSHGVPGEDDNSAADVCLNASGSPYTVTLAPFQYINNINNPPIGHLGVKTLTIGSGATLVIRGASSNNASSGSGGDVTGLNVSDSGSIATGGTLELLATDDNDGGGQSDNGGRGSISGGTFTNSGTFTSVSQTSQDAMQSHQNELDVSMDDKPGSSATVQSGTLQVDFANHVTNESTWTVAKGATMLLEYNGFNQARQTATSFTNAGSFVNSGTTIVNERDGAQVGDTEDNPIVWTAQGGSATGNPIQLTDGAELNDTAGGGPGSYLFNDREGQIAGVIPAAQTVTVEGDHYTSSAYTNAVRLLGSGVVNQGNLVLHSPNASSDQYTDTILTGSPLTNQGTITATSDVANLANELDVPLTNAHGASVNVGSSQLAMTNGQPVVNDGTIAIAPGASLNVNANPFNTGPETFTNAADGTIAPQVASATSFGTVNFGTNLNATLGGTVAPQLLGGYVPPVGTSLRAFTISGSYAPKLTGTFAAVTGGFSADYTHQTGDQPNYIALVFGGLPASPSVKPPIAALVRATAHKPTVKGTTLRVLLTCPKGSGCAPVSIKGTVAEKVAHKGKKATTKHVTVASATAILSGGQSKTVSLAINATGRKLLAHAHRIKVALTLASGGKTFASYSSTVSQAKKKAKAKR